MQILPQPLSKCRDHTLRPHYRCGVKAQGVNPHWQEGSFLLLVLSKIGAQVPWSVAPFAPTPRPEMDGQVHFTLCLSDLVFVLLRPLVVTHVIRLAYPNSPEKSSYFKAT